MDDAWTSGPLSYTITGLENGVRYRVEMRAVNSHSDGDWTGPTGGTPQGPLGQPSITSGSPGDRSLSMSWNPPSDNGGGIITSYDLRYIESNAPDKADNNWTVRKTVHTYGRYEYTLGGLTNNTGYDVQMRAVNADGDGLWSATETGTPTVTVVIPENGAPTFGDGLNTKRSVPENSGEGTSVGDPVVATDPNNDTLTYRIESQAGGPFTVNSNTGQIRVGSGANLDYESRRSHEVDLTVEDPGGLTDTIEVEIEITDVNETPVVTGNDDLEFQENRTGNIARYSASDPERESFFWSVDGLDGRFFSIDSRGYLSFNDPPDFEAGRGNIYELTVMATDTGGVAGELGVKITVTGVNEPPTVTGATDPMLTKTAELFSRSSPPAIRRGSLPSSPGACLVRTGAISTSARTEY